MPLHFQNASAASGCWPDAERVLHAVLAGLWNENTGRTRERTRRGGEQGKMSGGLGSLSMFLRLPLFYPPSPTTIRNPIRRARKPCGKYGIRRGWFDCAIYCFILSH
jgi:hypothetical protein